MNRIVGFLLLAPALVRAEPFLSRDPAALDPFRRVIEIGGSWGASRGAFDDEKHPIPFSQTAGAALARDAAVELRQGLAWDSEVRLTAGWATQEVKVDRGIGASGYLGADATRAEGPTDIAFAWKWSPPVTGDSALAVEAGFTAPLAKGPDRATSPGARLGTGGTTFPVGLRFAHRQGVITGYATGFWNIAVARHVSTWYGAPPGGRYVPAQSWWGSVGAEINPAAAGGDPDAREGPTWAVEFGRGYTGREKGDAAFAADLEPPTGSLAFVPSVAIPAGRRTAVHLAALLPLEGRNVYQMFTAAASVRVRL